MKSTRVKVVKKNYQSFYGEFPIERHVYQCNHGGKTYVPLESSAKIIGTTATPHFAKGVSFKYAQMSARMVAQDLEISTCRPTSEKLIQRLGSKVSEIVIGNEREMEYDLPKMPDPVHSISIGADGTTSPIRGEGYRETMCGTLSLYNKQGERMHTIYVACAPESGKEDFSWVMNWEITKLKKQFPDVKYIGLADGAKWNWTFLEAYVSVFILDF